MDEQQMSARIDAARRALPDGGVYFGDVFASEAERQTWVDSLARCGITAIGGHVIDFTTSRPLAVTHPSDRGRIGA